MQKRTSPRPLSFDEDFGSIEEGDWFIVREDYGVDFREGDLIEVVELDEEDSETPIKAIVIGTANDLFNPNFKGIEEVTIGRADDIEYSIWLRFNSNWIDMENLALPSDKLYFSTPEKNIIENIIIPPII